MYTISLNYSKMVTNLYTWNSLFENETNKEYYKKILLFLEDQRLKRLEIFPSEDKIFLAFKLTQLEGVKVVILGQDPYHNIGQANGLSFSVPVGYRIPPSLKNIIKELKEDVNIKDPTHGNLECWAKQGVLLLNSILTVQANEPASHNKIGWQLFTDSVISAISSNLNNVVFMFWGNYAIQKSKLVDKEKHLILEAAHPSPFSAHRGFLGCKHFSQANNYLLKNGKEIINWNII